MKNNRDEGILQGRSTEHPFLGGEDRGEGERRIHSRIAPLFSLLCIIIALIQFEGEADLLLVAYALDEAALISKTELLLGNRAHRIHQYSFSNIPRVTC